MNWTDKVSYWTSWHGSFSNRFRIRIQQVISKIKHCTSFRKHRLLFFKKAWFLLYMIESGYVCRIHDNPLEYTSFGKPNPFVFKNAEDVLKEIPTSHSNQGSHHFKTLYMVGDNPKIDIRGARQVLCSFSQSRDGYQYIPLIFIWRLKLLNVTGRESLVLNLDKNRSFQRER